MRLMGVIILTKRLKLGGLGLKGGYVLGAMDSPRICSGRAVMDLRQAEDVVASSAKA